MDRSTEERDALALLDAEIAARAEAISAAAAGWPCRAGCDLCCRRLARPPQLSALEWERLRAAIERLPDGAELRARLLELPEEGPLVCPLLDEARGECRVYEARPIACRTYGFYSRRDHQLICGEVERHVEHRAVVWGNHEVIDVRLERLAGPLQSLGAWLRDGSERPER